MLYSICILPGSVLNEVITKANIPSEQVELLFEDNSTNWRYVGRL